MIPEEFKRRLHNIHVPLDRRGADALGVPTQAFLGWTRGQQAIPAEIENVVVALETEYQAFIASLLKF